MLAGPVRPVASQSWGGPIPDNRPGGRAWETPSDWEVSCPLLPCSILFTVPVPVLAAPSRRAGVIVGDCH